MNIIIETEQLNRLTKRIINEKINISKINDFYDSINQSFDDEKNVSDKNKRAKQVAWSDSKSQNKRFGVLFDIGIKEGDSILDFGCGLGSMYDYIKEKKLNVNYTGVDINKDYINDDLSHFKKSVKFKRIKTINDVKEKFDWFLASGVFTIQFSIKDVIDIISKAYDKTKKGLSFNFIGDDKVKTTKNYEGFIVYNPEYVKSELEKHFDNVELKKNYLDLTNKFSDFTIHIKKPQ